VHAPEDAEGMFDVLTYYKGASVLRMLEQYLGEDRFRAGVRHYLDAHAYGNTETTDLWDSLEEATGEPCRRLMDSWILTGGFPLVTVEQGDSPRRLEVRQRPAALGADPDPQRRWLVPVILRIHHRDEVGEHRLLLEGDSAVLEVADDVTAVVANAGGHGFYRVRYDQPLLDGLLDVLDGMNSIERLALVDDVWGGVVAGTTEASTFVDLASRFDHEPHHEVWSALTGVIASPTGSMRGLVELERLLEPADRSLLAARIRALTEPMAERLGWEPVAGESDDVRLTRGCVLRARGYLGADEETISQARRMLKVADDDPDAVDAEVRAAAVQVVATHADDEDHETFEARYRAAATPQDEMRFLYALADCPGAERARRTLDLCFSDAVRSQNAPLAIRRLLLSTDLAVGRAAWVGVKEHWDEIQERFPRNLVPRMLEGVRALSTPELRDDVATFLDEHPIPQAVQTVAQIRQRLDVNVALRAREADRLARHLRG
jgi:puromycin-sensitive aminopeptidase